MDLGSVRALALDLNFAAHGLDAIVTLPDQDPVTARIVWLQFEADPVSIGGGAGFSRQDTRRVLALRRSEVPSVPRGSVIVAPELSGGEDKAWRVDGPDRVDSDHHRFVVVLDRKATADLPDEDEA